MATAADAGNKAEANAALARVTRAAANRSALVGVPANAGLGAIVAKAKANASRAVQVAKQMKNAANAAAKSRREAEAAAAKAAKAAAARAAADAKAAAAAQAAATARTAAAAEAARKAQEAANKQARNSAAAQAKAEANAAKAAKNAQAAKVREFVLKLWKLTPGNTNSRTKLWTPRIQNNAELTRQLNGLKGTLSGANIEAIKTNINKAATNKKIGYWGVWPAEKKNANLNNRIKQAKWIVNLGLGQQPTPPPPWREARKGWNAATIIGARWKGRKVRGAFLNAAQEAAKAAMAARAAASVPGGLTKAQQLAQQMRLAKIAENLHTAFINRPGQINNPINFNGINKTLLQGLTEQEIVNYLKTVNGFKPANSRKFSNDNLMTMARYFTAGP